MEAELIPVSHLSHAPTWLPPHGDAAALMLDDEFSVELPVSFLRQLQPAGAFLASHYPRNDEATTASLSPTRLQRPSVAMPPVMTPAARQLADGGSKLASQDKDGAVASSFLSAIRRGLDVLQQESDDDLDDDEDDDDDDDDDDSGYYQSPYTQYHAPTDSFTGRTSTQYPGLSITVPAPSPLLTEDDDLIFPMEL
ncbi:hypothetical protein PINS_up003399 [Pythium insidiosum]|nr:hypothetical protein PINS_up003399 [Pythium insidiosum]